MSDSRSRENHLAVQSYGPQPIVDPNDPPPSYEAVMSGSCDQLDDSTPDVRSPNREQRTSITIQAPALPTDSRNASSMPGWAYFNPMFQMPTERTIERGIDHPIRYHATHSSIDDLGDGDNGSTTPRNIIYHPEAPVPKRKPHTGNCSARNCILFWIVLFVVVIAVRLYIKKASKYRDDHSRRMEAQNLYVEQLRAAEEMQKQEHTDASIFEIEVHNQISTQSQRDDTEQEIQFLTTIDPTIDLVRNHQRIVEQRSESDLEIVSPFPKPSEAEKFEVPRKNVRER